MGRLHSDDNRCVVKVFRISGFLNWLGVFFKSGHLFLASQSEEWQVRKGRTEEKRQEKEFHDGYAVLAFQRMLPMDSCLGWRVNNTSTFQPLFWWSGALSHSSDSARPSIADAIMFLAVS